MGSLYWYELHKSNRLDALSKTVCAKSETLTVPLAHSTSSQHRCARSPNILCRSQVPELSQDSEVVDRILNMEVDNIQNFGDYDMRVEGR